MAHFERFTRGDCTSMTQHVERKKDKDGNYLKYKNGQIDTSRSHLNYNLAPKRDETQLEFIKTRTEELNTLKRKDVNVLGSWIVTVPKTVPEEHQHDFFQHTYKYLADMYAEKNVVSAYVHMDETTPHLHFCFVPVVHDSKKGREKVSCKECVTQLDLKRFHPDLQKSLDNWRKDNNYTFECDILNGATANGNMTVQQLKARSLEKENEKLKKDIEYQERTKKINENDIGKLIDKYDTASERLNSAQNELKTVQGTVDALKHEKAVLDRSVASQRDELDYLTPKIVKAREIKAQKADKGLFGKSKDTVTLDYQDYLNLFQTAAAVEDVLALEEELKKRQKDMESEEYNIKRNYNISKHYLSDAEKINEKAKNLKGDLNVIMRKLEDDAASLPMSFIASKNMLREYNQFRDDRMQDYREWIDELDTTKDINDFDFGL